MAHTSTSPCAALEHTSLASSGSPPSSAHIEPGRAAAASAITFARKAAMRNASRSPSMPLTARAAICPSEKPATYAGQTPRASSALATATESVHMAGWANAVSRSVSAEAFRHTSATSNPKASLAMAKVSATSGAPCSIRAAPMPGFCAPWPLKRNAIPMGYSLPSTTHAARPVRWALAQASCCRFMPLRTSASAKRSAMA